MAALIAAGVIWIGGVFAAFGYLPQPFYYDVSGSLMDYFTTAWWAHHQGAYSQWRSLYPPLSFDLLRLASDGTCYGKDDVFARSCDGIAKVTLLGLFLLNGVLAWLSFRADAPRTALPRAVAISVGLPMLYALERGNLLVPCFTAFMLGVGPLVRSPFGRWIALAVSVNFKPYLLAVFLPAVAQRDWRWLFGFGLAGLSVYLVSFYLEQSGTPWQLLGDMAGYAGGKRDAVWANLYFATSFWPLARFLVASREFASILPAGAPGVIAAAFLVLMRLAQLGALCCMVGEIIRPAAIDARRFMAVFAAIILTTVTNGSSGYAQFFLFFLIFFEPWRGPVRIVMLVATYLLCLPVDWAFLPVVHGLAHSFLGARLVKVSFGVSVGQIARPALLLVVQYGLIVLNLQDIARGSPARWNSSVAAGSVAGACPTL